MTSLLSRYIIAKKYIFQIAIYFQERIWSSVYEKLLQGWAGYFFGRIPNTRYPTDYLCRRTGYCGRGKSFVTILKITIQLGSVRMSVQTIKYVFPSVRPSICNMSICLKGFLNKLPNYWPNPKLPIKPKNQYN